jgi:hypothetical protein
MKHLLLTTALLLLATPLAAETIVRIPPGLGAVPGPKLVNPLANTTANEARIHAMEERLKRGTPLTYYRNGNWRAFGAYANTLGKPPVVRWPDPARICYLLACQPL